MGYLYWRMLQDEQRLLVTNQFGGDFNEFDWDVAAQGGSVQQGDQASRLVYRHEVLD